MVRFVLLAHARSGSNLMCCGLYKHNNVHMFSELFNESEDERQRSYRASFQDCEVGSKPHPSVNVNVDHRYSDDQDGAEFLRNSVFYRHAQSPVAIGFKMFFHQARTSANARKAWQYLACDNDVKVIHLTRRNLVESWVSLRLAFQTGKWIYRADADETATAPAPELLYLKPIQFLNYSRQVIAGQRWVRFHFRNHPMLEVEYKEDLCERFDETMNRIQDFLEVPRQPSKQMLRKQAQRKPSEQIGNYEELKAHFAHTPFAPWFDA